MVDEGLSAASVFNEITVDVTVTASIAIIRIECMEVPPVAFGTAP
jgi:hypothetical protein